LPESGFRLFHRFSAYSKENIIKSLKTKEFTYYIIAWLLTFQFLLSSIEYKLSFWTVLWLFLYSYFWFRLNTNIVNKIKPPVELLLILIVIFYGIEYSINGYILDKYGYQELNLGDINQLVSIGHKLFLSLYILLFGLILVINSSKNVHSDHVDENRKEGNRQGTLLFYTFWGIFAHYLIFYDYEYYLYFFQIFLILILLKKTTWLEKLTKKELWIYFFIFIFIFNFIHVPVSTEEVKYIFSSQLVSWFSIPLYLFLLTNAYFWVLLIKIPIVIIYNHASLSRKLWISGLFQSTFPQFIQFIFLIFVFYFFIASWQAEKLRNALYSQFEQIKKDTTPKLLDTLNQEAKGPLINIPGYQPIILPETPPNQGILILSKSVENVKTIYQKKDYFIYLYSEGEIYLCKIDSSFCTNLSSNATILVGTGIIIYPYTPKVWQSSLYNWRLLEDENKIKIYPFDAISNNDLWVIRTAISGNDYSSKDGIQYIEDDLGMRRKLVIGRILIPIINNDKKFPSYLIFDIYFDFKSAFSSPLMTKIILVLILLSFLFNLFIIRRVVKFGSQINKIIIQKFNQLKTGIKKISAGNFEYKFQLEGEDEFVELAGHFNEMGERLKIKIDEAREKDRLDQELKIARQVQFNLLPRSIPDVPGYKIAASLQTATEIGGDFYDILPLKDNLYLYSIGDVSGKGSSAAFYMAQFMSLLRLSHQFTNDPSEIAEHINKYFVLHVSDPQIFVTAIIGFLNASHNRIRFIRAGHVKPILIKGGKNKAVREIYTGGLGIGLTKEQNKFKNALKVHELILKQGDKIVFYTDGLVEAARPSTDMSGKMDVYGEDRLMEMLTKHYDREAFELIEEISKDLNLFYGENAIVDDYTLLIIQRL
jgi:serine phosphatase RsbU (regulator of sigma subunit)